MELSISKQLRTINIKTLFWTLQIIGWSAAGLILFLSGLSHQSILSSTLRNTLFALLGFGLSLGLRQLYKLLWTRYQSLLINGVAAFLLSYACGLISGLVLNLITFHLFRGGLGPEPLQALFAGVLNFSLVFMNWSACYYAVKYYLNPLSKSDKRPSYLQRLSVESKKQLILIKTKNISFIQADGEYIKIHSNGSAYLLRKPLGELEKQLDPTIFQRIHRSYIVNINDVASLRPHTNGEYFVMLINGVELKMSRSYRHVLKTHFGTAI